MSDAAVQRSTGGGVAAQAGWPVLAAGSLRASLAPEMGGRIAGLWRETPQGPDHAMVPLQAGPFDPWNWPKAGIYPLVPYSNRIRDGRFTAAGLEVRLPPHPGTPHALHGFAQQRAWTLATASPCAATLRYDHVPDAWPWAFAAEQRLDLDAAGLTVAIAVRNLSDAPMPAGLGLHPYLAVEPGDRIRFAADWAWDFDGDFVATGRRALAAAERVHDAPHGADGVTRYLSGWGREAVVDRPGRAPLRLTASDALDHLVFHVPPGGGYACIEPVSHVADAFNLAAGGAEGTGHRLVPPGGTFTASLRIGIG